jgi:TetR/AcrR family transcriptional regulator, transcriptional repressor for nem operon
MFKILLTILLKKKFGNYIPIGIYLYPHFLTMTKSEQTRAFIIEKTAPIFNKKGYAGTSLSDITGATSLTKGSIYGNFANKDEVALAAFDYNLRRVNSIVNQEMAKYKSAKEKLLVYGKVYNGYTGYPFPVGGCPILNTATDSDDTHPELKKKVLAAISSWKSTLVTILETGIKAKEFRATINAEKTALTMIALIEGAIMISNVTGKPAFRTAIMESLAEFIEQLK